MNQNNLSHLDGNQAISTSKEESLAKAFEILQSEYCPRGPGDIVRPDIDMKRILLLILFWVGALGSVYLLAWLVGIPFSSRAIITALCAFVLFVARAKDIIIGLIHIYQRYAPAELRSACVFEPSCSQYMILAVEKYGPISGVRRGIRRLLRCHYPNGGIDYP